MKIIQYKVLIFNKTIHLILLLLFSILNISCDTADVETEGRKRFYYYKGEKVFLEEDTGYIGVAYNSETTFLQANEINLKFGLPEVMDSINSHPIEYNKIFIGYRKKTSKYLTKYGEGNNQNLFGNHPFVRYSTSFFRHKNGHLGLSDEFIANFNPDLINQEGIDAMNKKYKITIVQKNPWEKYNYLLRVCKESPNDALDMANLYYESKLTIYSKPNFWDIYSPYEDYKY